MGFSVSGSFAILVVASFIAFGMAYTAGANSFERVTDATMASHDNDLDRLNTAISIAGAVYEGDSLEVNVTNNGTTALSVNATDLIVDGTYHPPDEFETLTVDGDPDTGVWLPGERLSIRIELPGLTTPARVKVVTEHGIADAVEVS